MSGRISKKGRASVSLSTEGRGAKTECLTLLSQLVEGFKSWLELPFVGSQRDRLKSSPLDDAITDYERVCGILAITSQSLRHIDRRLNKL